MVSSEIERLRGRLDERTHEFERLRVEQMRDAKENVSLKVRLEELNRAKPLGGRLQTIQVDSIQFNPNSPSGTNDSPDE